MTTIEHVVIQSALESGALFRQMAVYLLFGFAANALVALLVPERWILKHLGQRGFKGVLWATLLGIPLPLCSCSVLPMAMGLRSRGASIGATVAFLIATPQTGVDSILVTGQVIGWSFAIFKVIAALITGLLAGAIAEWWLGSKNDPAEEAARAEAAAALNAAPVQSWSQRFRHAATVGLWDFPASLGGVLVAGIVIGGVISALLPPDALVMQSAGGKLASMTAMLLMAVPMYVCSTGSVPIAAGFHHAGVPQGALLIFLMAGPATNIAEISVVKKQLGWRALAVFLGVIVVASLGLGMVFEDVSGLVQFNAATAMPTGHEHHMQALASGAASAAAHLPAASSMSATATTPLTLGEWLSVITLAVLLLLPPIVKLYKQFLGKKEETLTMAEKQDGLQTYEFALSGLNCDHCIRSAKNSLEGLPGLESLTVSLKRAVLRGKDLNTAEVVSRVKKQGFEAELAPPEKTA